MGRLLRHIRKILNNGPNPVILMYHRVADLPYDPWGLAVTPKRFADQIRALKACRLPLSVTEFVARLDDGTLPRHAVAMTFDDGYADNLTHAKPVLDQAAVPATIFLTTSRLGHPAEFWWDELARLVFDRRAPAEGTLQIGGQAIDPKLPPLASGASIRSHWRAWQPPETEREQLYYDAWQRLRHLGGAEREQDMQAIRELLQEGAPDPVDLPMASDDVLHLVSGSNIEIGAHSRTHQPLTTLSHEQQRQEIEGSRTDCERLLGRPVKGFAYPHGDRDSVTMGIVRDAGFDWACSTHGAAVSRARFDRFDLPRLQVMNWDEEEFAHEIQNARCDA